MADELSEASFLMKKLYLNAVKFQRFNFEAYNCPERQIAIQFRQMLRDYEQWHRLVKYREKWWNTQIEKERIDEFERFIVENMLDMCFCMSYEDSDVVSKLLSTLFDTDEHFEELFGDRPKKLFDPKKFGLEDLEKIVRYQWSYRGKKYIVKEERIKYFIEHGIKQKSFFLRFGENWLRRKLDTHEVHQDVHRGLCRKSESIFFTDPNILSKFLEHGMFSSANIRDENVKRLLKGILDIWLAGGFLTEFPLSTDSKRNAKALEVAAMLLRAVKSVHRSVYLLYLLLQNANTILGIEAVQPEDILPMVETRCMGPQKLQHLCRWEIRKQMCDCQQLPDGISVLPVPKSLQQYLELKMDERNF